MACPKRLRKFRDLGRPQQRLCLPFRVEEIQTTRLLMRSRLLHALLTLATLARRVARDDACPRERSQLRGVVQRIVRRRIRRLPRRPRRPRRSGPRPRRTKLLSVTRAARSRSPPLRRCRTSRSRSTPGSRSTIASARRTARARNQAAPGRAPLPATRPARRPTLRCSAPPSCLLPPGASCSLLRVRAPRAHAPVFAAQSTDRRAPDEALATARPSNLRLIARARRFVCE